MQDSKELKVQYKLILIVYRTSCKNSAPLIIQHPSAESGQITSIFDEAIPNI